MKRWGMALLAVVGLAGMAAAAPIELRGKASSVYAFPNPAHTAGGDAVTIRFPAARAAVVRVYSLSGEIVAVLRAPEVVPDEGRATWNGRNVAGETVASGVYLFVVTGASHWVGKLTIIN